MSFGCPLIWSTSSSGRAHEKVTNESIWGRMIRRDSMDGCVDRAPKRLLRGTRKPVKTRCRRGHGGCGRRLRSLMKLGREGCRGRDKMVSEIALWTNPVSICHWECPRSQLLKASCHAGTRLELRYK